MPNNSKANHLRALVKKNFIIWKRNWYISIFEIGIPIGIICFNFLFRSLQPLTDLPETSYVSKATTIFPNFPQSSEWNLHPRLNIPIPPWFKNCVNNTSLVD